MRFIGTFRKEWGTDWNTYGVDVTIADWIILQPENLWHRITSEDCGGTFILERYSYAVSPELEEWLILKFR